MTTGELMRKPNEAESTTTRARHQIIEALDKCDISDAALVKATGCDRRRLAKILDGSRPASEGEALLFERYFGIPTKWWHERGKAKQMARE